MAAILTLASTLATEAKAIDGEPDRCRSIELVDRDDGTILLRYMEPTFRTRPDLDVVLADAAALNL